MIDWRHPPTVPAGRLDHVPTPALVVDLAAARRNHARAMAMLGPHQVLRPHFKAHKSTALMHLQTGGDPSRPVCCQTSWEAQTLARAGYTDILVTNEFVDRLALAELADAARSARLAILADDPEHVRRAETAAASANVRLDILIEINVGMRRCGVAPDAPLLLELARLASNSPHLRLAGLQGYGGQVTVVADPMERVAAIRKSAALIRAARDTLVDAGYAVDTISGGSTAHLPFADETAAWNEVQGGSYLLMDAAYGEFPDLPFEQAAFALATVISRAPGYAVLDIGLKQLTTDKGSPAWLGASDRPLRLSDEHTVVPLADGEVLSVGDRTWLYPRHIDPTVNLFPEIWFYQDGSAAPVAVDGRQPAARAAALDLRQPAPAVAG